MRIRRGWNIVYVRAGGQMTWYVLFLKGHKGRKKERIGQLDLSTVHTKIVEGVTENFRSKSPPLNGLGIVICSLSSELPSW